ncbi:hypothetical protein [Sphingopyxis panaciterrulae]|uniref:hypothetical protein n=1 Tax=Sphingopyxis panaciterrulae TaxID=462372 RepID=UPI0016173681|nr:hypothetical protein [Sphingopyxis panaciterrulae]
MKSRCLVLLSVSAALPCLASAQTVEDRARAAAEAARAKSGDSEAILENYINPGLSGQPIATVDKSRTFTPNLACQKTANFLELLVQPGAGGDITTVRIARDKDIDGTFDSVSTLPVPVSGICANGVISCQPGSWTGCRTFQWDVDSGGDLKLSEVEMPELAGCYCINNSCGANLVMGNLPSVLKDLGGGAIGALSTHDPRIGVADARVNGPLIQYVGAQSTACSPDPALPQTAYRANPTTIQGDAFAASEANSLFQSLAGSPAGTGRAEQVRACTIEREISFLPLTYDDIVSASGAIYSVRDCGEGCRRYRIIGDGNCSGSPPIFTASFAVSDPAKLVSARIVEMGADDWVQGRINGRIVGSAGPRPWLTIGLPSGDCRTDGGAARNYTSYDFTADLRAGPTSVSARVRGGGGGAPLTTQWGLVDVDIRVSPGCEPRERLVDLCSGYGADPKCRLDSESVDTVQTFHNGVGTGLRPLPQTRLFGTDSCTIQLTRDFFRRERTYKCVVDNGVLPEPDLSRGAYIIDHSTETMLADRVRTTDGGTVASTRPFALPDRGSVPRCEAICKTRAPKVNSDAAPDGIVGAKQTNPTGWDTFYHACASDNVCPAGPGEQIVSACGCLDDFPEAVVMMQTVRLAGADLACTATAR